MTRVFRLFLAVAVLWAGSATLALAQAGGNPNNAVGLWGQDSVTGLPCIVAPASGPGSATCVVPTGGGGSGGGAVTVADGADVTQGAKADTACATDNGTCTVAALLKRANQRLTSAITAIGSPFQAGGSVGISGTLPGFTATPTFNLGTLNGASTAAKQPALGTSSAPSTDFISVQGDGVADGVYTSGTASSATTIVGPLALAGYAGAYFTVTGNASANTIIVSPSYDGSTYSNTGLTFFNTTSWAASTNTAATTQTSYFVPSGAAVSIKVNVLTYVGTSSTVVVKLARTAPPGFVNVSNTVATTINASGAWVSGTSNNTSDLQIGGYDGSVNRRLLTNTSGNLQIVGTGTAATPATDFLSTQADGVIDSLSVSGTATSATTIIGPQDTTGYQSVTFDILNTASNSTFVAEFSTDNVNWRTAYFTAGNGGGQNAPTQSTQSSNFYSVAVSAKWFRVRISSYASGTASVVANFRKAPLQAQAIQIGGVNVPSAGGDGGANASAGLQVYSRPQTFNGTTWDRQYSATAGNATTGTGVPAAGTLGKYNSTQPTYTDGQYGNQQLDSRGNLRTTIMGADGVTGVAVADWSADGRSSATNGVTTRTLQYGANGSTIDRLRTIQGADGTGLGITATAVAPQSNANGAIVSVVSTAAESSHIIKGAAANAYGCNWNTGATSGWFLLLNATTVPADGAVTPVKFYQVAANSTLGVDFTSGGVPIRLGTGAVWTFSSTGPFTLTKSATAVGSCEVQ